jgi:hypothetical protein
MARQANAAERRADGIRGIDKSVKLLASFLKPNFDPVGFESDKYAKKRLKIQRLDFWGKLVTQWPEVCSSLFEAFRRSSGQNKA